jgi:hypothetical protein
MEEVIFSISKTVWPHHRNLRSGGIQETKISMGRTEKNILKRMLISCHVRFYALKLQQNRFAKTLANFSN